jgi:hypothetical protein
MKKPFFLNTLFFTGILLLTQCSQERPVRQLPPDAHRILKKDIEGKSFFFLKSVNHITTPGPAHRYYAPGFYLTSDSIIKARILENTLDLISIDPLYHPQTTKRASRILASFPIVRHFSIERKKNLENEDTFIEEENTTRLPWNQREYMVVDFSQDLVDPLQKQTLKASVLEPLTSKQTSNAKQFLVEKLLDDGTSIELRYSLLPDTASPTYVQREYSREAQRFFGFSKTTLYPLDGAGRITESQRKEFINRRDPTKPWIYYFSENFPERFKPQARKAFALWAAALKKANPALRLDPPLDNTGQKLGELDSNIFYYDDTEVADHNCLGYGPVFTHPRTGEIIKSDIILYGAVIKRAAFREGLLTENDSSDLAFLPDNNHSNWSDVLPVSPSQPLISLFSPSAGYELWRKYFFKSRTDRLARNLTSTQDFTYDSGFWENNTRSASQLEDSIFENIATHEMGHNIGLRHNFEASADKQHYEKGHVSSSIMDYLPFRSEPAYVGPYDEAALRFAYNDSQEIQNQEIQKGFLYCTDENLADPRLGLCLQFDLGSDLTEVVRNQIRAYRQNYYNNNLRLDAVDFDSDSPAYKNRILSLLLPFRLVFDHSYSIEQARESSDFERLWSLTKKRIEADEKDLRKDPDERKQLGIFPLTLSSTLGGIKKKFPNTIYLDNRKIDLVVADAKRARNAAIVELSEIILDTKHSNYKKPDPTDNRPMERGVLFDKLVALTLIAEVSTSPVDEKIKISPFLSNSHPDVLKLFINLISNTIGGWNDFGTHYFVYQEHDIKLRQKALELTKKELTKVEGERPLRLVDLLPLEKVYASIQPQENQNPSKKVPASKPVTMADTVAKQDTGNIGAATAQEQQDPWPSIKNRLPSSAGSPSYLTELSPPHLIGRGFLDTHFSKAEELGITILEREMKILQLKDVKTDISSTIKDFSLAKKERDLICGIPYSYSSFAEGAYYRARNRQQFTTPTETPTPTGVFILHTINRLEYKILAIDRLISSRTMNGEISSWPSNKTLDTLKAELDNKLKRERAFLDEIYNSIQRE